MSDLLWKVFEISINLFESFVVIHFICAFLNHDFKSFRGKVVYIVGVLADFSVVTILNQFTIYEGLLGAIYISIFILYSCLFLNGTFLKKIFTACITNIVLIFVNALVTNIVSTVFKDNLTLIYEEMSVARVCSIIVVQILLICVYNVILKLSFVSLNKSEWKIILSVFSISFISLAFIHIALINMETSDRYAKFVMVAEFGIIILNVVCLYMTCELSRSNAETEKMRMQRQQEEYSINYAENIREQYEEMRRMRHDMKQNVAVIAALYNDGKYDEACKYVDKLSDNLDRIEIIVNVRNVFINAILNTKLSIAKGYGIQVLCTLSSNIVGIEDVDLCILLGNMLDNAIEAAKNAVTGTGILRFQ